MIETYLNYDSNVWCLSNREFYSLWINSQTKQIHVSWFFVIMESINEPMVNELWKNRRLWSIIFVFDWISLVLIDKWVDSNQFEYILTMIFFALGLFFTLDCTVNDFLTLHLCTTFQTPNFNHYELPQYRST